MIRTSALAAAAVALVLSLSKDAGAVELSYQWKKGDVHRFEYADDTTFNMNMPGMPMPSGAQKIAVKSTFSEKVLAVHPDGTAEVDLTVEKMEVRQNGTVVATEAQLPPAARTVKAEIDRKGHAKFFKMVTVYMKDDHVLIALSGSASAGPNGGRATATAGGQTVELVAGFDPKTGRITASATVTEAKTEEPKLKPVQVKEEDPKVDVLPKQILDMMVLPDGDMPPGTSVTLSSMLGDVTMSLAPLEKLF